MPLWIFRLEAPLDEEVTDPGIAEQPDQRDQENHGAGGSMPPVVYGAACAVAGGGSSAP
jgi:hypothetical protein